MELSSSGNDLITLIDIIGNSYQTTRLSTSPTGSNLPSIILFQSVTESALYIEIDALSQRLLTRVTAAFNYVISQILPTAEVSRLQKIKLISAAGGTSMFVAGKITIWGEPE